MSVTKHAQRLDPALPKWTSLNQYIPVCDPPPRPRVVVVSSIWLYRIALRQSLIESSEVEVVGMSSIEAIAEQIGSLSPDVLVLDATGSNTMPVVRSLKALAPEIRVVVVTYTQDEGEFLAWAEAGVSGYVDQNSSAADLAAAVQYAARGEVLCSPRLVGMLTSRIAKLSAERQRLTRFDALTPREREVIALVAEGLSNKQIAQRLSISDTTTKNHVHNILDKLGLQSRSQMAVQYIRMRQQARPEPRSAAG
jgi:two-component system, NarL family, nitrate/nitrite response regulator NarL